MVRKVCMGKLGRSYHFSATKYDLTCWMYAVRNAVLLLTERMQYFEGVRWDNENRRAMVAEQRRPRLPIHTNTSGSRSAETDPSRNLQTSSLVDHPNEPPPYSSLHEHDMQPPPYSPISPQSEDLPSSATGSGSGLTEPSVGVVPPGAPEPTIPGRRPRQTTPQTSIFSWRWSVFIAVFAFIVLIGMSYSARVGQVSSDLANWNLCMREDVSNILQS